MTRRVTMASLVWGLGILLSRLIGLVREVVLGRTLGAGADADLYQAAFIVPDFLNYLLAGGALSIVFIPIFAGYLQRDEEDQGWEAFSAIASWVGLAAALGVALLWGFADRLLPFVVPGFSDSALAELTVLVRIVLPAQFFHVVGGLISATLQARDRHALPAMAPLLYTGSVVVGGLVGGVDAGPYGFCWGVLVGSVIGPFGLPLIGALRAGLRYRPRFTLGHPDLGRYFAQALPIMIAFSVVVADEWVFKHLASDLQEGAVARMSYARNLMRVPMGVFGLAIGAATFPTLSRFAAANDDEGLFDTLASAVKRVIVLALGAQVLLTVAGAEISTVIYGGRVSAADHNEIGLLLAIMCVSLWAWSIQNVLARGYYARGMTWLPSLLGTGLMLAAYPGYAYLGQRWGTLGLACAGMGTIAVYVVGLLFKWHRDFAERRAGWMSFALRLGPALAAGLASGLGVRELLPPGADPSLVDALWRGAVYGSVGLCVYGVAAWVLRVDEFHALASRLGARVRRGQPTNAPEAAGSDKTGR